MSRRMDQLNELFIKEASLVILKELDLPFGSFVTLTKVRISSDLREGKIWASVFPSNKKEEIISFLNNRKGIFRKIFKNRLSLKRIPQIRFVADETEEKASEIDSLIDSIEN